jgi:hypothetical protein
MRTQRNVLFNRRMKPCGHFEEMLRGQSAGSEVVERTAKRDKHRFADVAAVVNVGGRGPGGLSAGTGVVVAGLPGVDMDEGPGRWCDGRIRSGGH